MVRLLIAIVLMCFLTSCKWLNMENNTADDQYARCKEIKRRLLFQNATNDELVATQRAGEIDALYRSYRENGCS